MNLVGAGFCRDVEVTAGATAGFGVAGGLQRVFLEGVDGIDDTGNAGDPTLVDSVDLEVEVVVVGAVNGVVQLVAAHAIDRARVVIAGKRRGGAEKLREIAAVQRRILQGDAREGGGLCNRGGVERKSIGSNFHRGGFLRDRQLYRQRKHLTRQQLHVAHCRGGKAACLDLDGVGAGLKVIKGEFTRTRGDHGLRRGGCSLGGSYFGAGDHGT